jgi:hypothetical protein
MSVFQNASHFSVNVLGVSQQALALKFATTSKIRPIVPAVKCRAR